MKGKFDIVLALIHRNERLRTPTEAWRVCEWYVNL